MDEWNEFNISALFKIFSDRSVNFTFTGDSQATMKILNNMIPIGEFMRNPDTPASFFDNYAKMFFYYGKYEQYTAFMQEYSGRCSEDIANKVLSWFVNSYLCYPRSDQPPIIRATDLASIRTRIDKIGLQSDFYSNAIAERLSYYYQCCHAHVFEWIVDQFGVPDQEYVCREMDKFDREISEDPYDERNGAQQRSAREEMRAYMQPRVKNAAA